MANPCTRSRDDKIVAGKPANRPSDQGRRSEKNTGARGTILKCSEGMEPSVEPGFDSQSPVGPDEAPADREL
jgi:hypothetical protein